MMEFLVGIHDWLFNTQTMLSFVIGIYALFLSFRSKPLSGNFFGTIAVYAIVNIVVLVIGMILLANNYVIASDGRTVVYVLYMLFLIVILPGIFSIMRGRDDNSAAMTFGASALFNAAVSFSMFERGLAVWILAVS